MTLLSVRKVIVSKPVLLQSWMFDSGHIPTNLIRYFFKRNKSDDGSSVTLVQCVAVPVRLKLKRRHGRIFYGYPGAISMVLVRDRPIMRPGRPVETKLPWIHRDSLAPLTEDKTIILRSVDAVDTYQIDVGG
jgi:hypothetical protein